jgi:hypothetical protein
MEFYSFRFGDMKVAQADPASEKLVAVEMSLGFKTPGRPVVEAIELTLHVAQDEAKSVAATQREAYAAAQALLGAAADYVRSRSCEALAEETEKNRAFAVKAS